MTHFPAFNGALTHRGRVLAVATLAALALSGCAGGQPSGGGPGGSVDAEAIAASASPEQAAFAAMLDEVAQPCPSTAGAAPRPTAKKPTGPVGQHSLAPGETPPTDPIEPAAPTGPETELNDRDRCLSVQHEQRIIEALQAVSKPTPAKVRETLNDLGYIDERIHGLRQEGEATRFYLDLREDGGRLCEAGLAAGEQTDVTVCATPVTGQPM
ncbi:hypothetical protein ACIBSW_11995 [Actinoplanes sp. NPDC049668]|uniref:hypothetical protein n=1 Tax=unclassified Actinoplanes TaxID=2626549 RepID=UPI0033AA2BCA